MQLILLLATMRFMAGTQKLSFSDGFPLPYGISRQGDGINFSLFSQSARKVILCIFDRESRKSLGEISLKKTGSVWHILVQNPPENATYSYKVDKNNLLLDPYAKSVNTPIDWGRVPGEKGKYLPQGDLFIPPPFDWEGDKSPDICMEDLIIYEVHVRGFTHDASSKVKHPGTFLGIIEKIPHFKELGINAVELMPLQEFNENEFALTHPILNKSLYNYWGYSTVNFFAPMNRYASSSAQGAAIEEFKMMVKELHLNGIEVILDVVFNHTAEGNVKGPVLSYKGIDHNAYYIYDEKGELANYTGCGNTVNCNQFSVQELIINCLRYWVLEMHVDGFRFDLASIFFRGEKGEFLALPPLVKAITEDPVLSSIKLIAEPWDAVGLYQVGDFYASSCRWMEWNGKYRDAVRKFIKGDSGSAGEFAMRLCGSEDLYHTRTPLNSINFVAIHDGFSLQDLVSYNEKHNLDNEENNQDGSSFNDSWNCGIEGATTNQKILFLRERQKKNFFLALMLSQGIPMLQMGDEYGHTKNGNNNTWCQDNELNWFLWDKLSQNRNFYRFVRLLIEFRSHHSILRRKTFLTPNDIEWHGVEPFKADWSAKIKHVSYTLKDPKGHDLYVIFNMNDLPLSFKVPNASYSKKWHWVVNTASLSPHDFYEKEQRPLLATSIIKMIPHSAILLIAE